MATDPFLSQIQLFAFNFPPKGWAACNGQLLPINQNQALFALLGTTYGGDGKVTFALPDLRGRVPIGVSPSHTLGERTGSESSTLTLGEMPAHQHVLDTAKLTATARCRNDGADLPTPVGNTFATVNPGLTLAYSNSPDADMKAASVGFGGSATTLAAGSGQPHENLQPYLTLQYCIALQGIFPSQN